MNLIKKVLIIFAIVLCITTIFSVNFSEVQAAKISSVVRGIQTGEVPEAGELTKVLGRVLGLLRILTGLLSVIVIAYTGFQFVTETPEGKSKLKEKMMPIVIGVLLAFMATTIATFIVGIFNK